MDEKSRRNDSEYPRLKSAGVNALQLVILKADKDAEGEDMMVSIDDDEEFDRVGEIFLKRIEEIFEGEDDEEDDFE